MERKREREEKFELKGEKMERSDGRMEGKVEEESGRGKKRRGKS